MVAVVTDHDTGMRFPAPDCNGDFPFLAKVR
jgi:hypothetical protein